MSNDGTRDWVRLGRTAGGLATLAVILALIVANAIPSIAVNVNEWMVGSLVTIVIALLVGRRTLGE